MELAAAFDRVAYYFDVWSRVVEGGLRRRAVARWAGRGRATVLSPPTDCGTRLLAAVAEPGSLSLTCFSDKARARADRYLRSHGITQVATHHAEYCKLPFDDGSLDALFGNCFFDFVAPPEMHAVLCEIRRVLKPGGLLLGAYMRPPRTLLERIWARVLALLGPLAGGVHPVVIGGELDRSGFRIETSRSVAPWGCPIQELVAVAVPSPAGTA